MKKKEPKITERFKNQIISYEQKQKDFKELEKEFNTAKNNFKTLMDAYFSNSKDKQIIIDADSIEPTSIVVTKIQRSNIFYNIPKLIKTLGKSKSNKVIKKNHTIIDMDGLIKYLQSLNANPSIFKKFIVTTKTVDEEALNQLGELGEVNLEDLKGCYKVSLSDPYYRISSKAKKVKGEDEW